MSDLTELRARLREWETTGRDDTIVPIRLHEIRALLDALDAADAVAKAGADEMALAHEWRRRAEQAEERAAKAEIENDARMREELSMQDCAMCRSLTRKLGEVRAQNGETVQALSAKLATARAALTELAELPMWLRGNESHRERAEHARAALAALDEGGEGEGS